MERKYLPKTMGSLQRSRVSALFAEGMEYQLVTVMAGPGYGKTMAAADYFRYADLRLVWVRFFYPDNSPGRFWDRLVDAVEREIPQLAPPLRELGFPGSAAQFDHFVRLLADEVYQGGRVALVVDDYERVQGHPILTFFEGLIDAGVENLTLVLLCNEKMPFAGIYPDGGHFRITAQDLSFTFSEAQALFASFHADLTETEIRQAVLDTDGWPMALRLMCSELARGGDAPTAKLYLHMVAELFEQHFFSQYSAAVKSCLIRLSMLPSFPLQLVRLLALAAADDLLELLFFSPFVSYDHEAELFHFQKMYHEYLNRKRALLPREEILDTYEKAGRCFLDMGFHYEALDCFWEAGCYDEYMDTMWRLPRVGRSIDTSSGILARLESIPAAYSQAHISVDFSRAFMYMDAMQTDKAHALLLKVEQRLKPLQDEASRLMLGDVYTALADVSIFMNRDDGLPYIKQAAKLLPSGGRLRNKGLLVVGNNGCFFLPGPQAGQVQHMVDYMFEFAKYSDKVSNGSGYGHEYLFAAEAALLCCQMERAAEHYLEAIQKAQSMEQHDIICNSWWGMMRIAFYEGDYKKAKEALDTIVRYVDDHALMELYELRDCAASLYHLRMGNCDRVSAWFGAKLPGRAELPRALGRNRLLLAQYLLETKEYAKSFAVLTQLEALFEQRGLWQERVSLYLARAARYVVGGETEPAVAEFRKAYDMVYANDIRLPLVECGKTLMQIIDTVKASGAEGFDGTWLMAVYEDAVAFAKRGLAMVREYNDENRLRPPAKPVLTERETETLYFMAHGLTQEEIGKMMNISVNAVKKHVAKIYTKLGAVNRADAIHIASINGMVNLLE